MHYVYRHDSVLAKICEDGFKIFLYLLYSMRVEQGQRK